MAESFFTTNFMGTEAGNTDPQLFTTDTKQSAQGQLASQYTNALTAALTNAEVADYFAYVHFAATGDANAAQSVYDAILGGDFSLADLFGAAQSKTGPVDGSNISDPTPTMHLTGDLAGISFDLTTILTGLDTESWVYVDTINSGKKVSTVTTYHSREFYTGIEVPEHPGWGNGPNEAPVATPFTVDDAVETQSVYNSAHEVVNRPPTDVLEIDLRAGATDADGDSLTVSGAVSLSANTGTLTLTKDVTWWVDGDTLKIDQNSPELDGLLKDATNTLTFSYSLTDGKSDPVATYVDVTITGTKDQYEGFGEGAVSKEYTGNANNTNQVLTALPNDTSLPDGFLEFVEGSVSYQSGGTIKVQSTGLTDNEGATVSDATPTDWSGGSIQVGKISANTFLTENSAPLTDTALDDGVVNYNANNNSIGSNDTVTVSIEYSYDYWYWA